MSEIVENENATQSEEIKEHTINKSDKPKDEDEIRNIRVDFRH